MMGKRGLRYINFFKQLAGTFLPCLQELHNADTIFITKSFKNRCCSLFINIQQDHLT